MNFGKSRGNWKTAERLKNKEIKRRKIKIRNSFLSNCVSIKKIDWLKFCLKFNLNAVLLPNLNIRAKVKPTGHFIWSKIIASITVDERKEASEKKCFQHSCKLFYQGGETFSALFQLPLYFFRNFNS